MTSSRRQIVGKTKSTIAAGVVLATMVTSLGVAVSSSGASGTSAFCKTMFTFKPANPPTKVTTANYHLWAKSYLPLFEKLASEAPSNSAKSALKELVTILKYESTSKSVSGLTAYISANRTQWANGFSTLTKAIISCAL